MTRAIYALLTKCEKRDKFDAVLFKRVWMIICQQEASVTHYLAGGGAGEWGVVGHFLLASALYS